MSKFRGKISNYRKIINLLAQLVWVVDRAAVLSGIRLNCSNNSRTENKFRAI